MSRRVHRFFACSLLMHSPMICVLFIVLPVPFGLGSWEVFVFAGTWEEGSAVLSG